MPPGSWIELQWSQPPLHRLWICETKPSQNCSFDFWTSWPPKDVLLSSEPMAIEYVMNMTVPLTPTLVIGFEYGDCQGTTAGISPWRLRLTLLRGWILFVSMACKGGGPGMWFAQSRSLPLWLNPSGIIKEERKLHRNMQGIPLWHQATNGYLYRRLTQFFKLAASKTMSQKNLFFIKTCLKDIVIVTKADWYTQEPWKDSAIQKFWPGPLPRCDLYAKNWYIS
jgi:hypothetical protein